MQNMVSFDGTNITNDVSFTSDNLSEATASQVPFQRDFNLQWNLAFNVGSSIGACVINFYILISDSDSLWNFRSDEW